MVFSEFASKMPFFQTNIITVYWPKVELEVIDVFGLVDFLSDFFCFSKLFFINTKLGV